MVVEDMYYLVKVVIKDEINIINKILQDFCILWNTLAYSGVL